MRQFFFNAYLWVSFSAFFFLDLDWLNTSFKCCSVCKVSEKVANNDIAWCHILTILVEAMSPCDLLLGAVSNRCIFGGCGSQTTGGTLKGLNMRMLGKRLVEDEIDKIKPYRFKPYVWCFGVHSMYSEVYIPWTMTSCGGNGGKGDDFPPKVNGQIRGTPNPRRSMVRFPQEGPFLSPVVHQYYQVTGILGPLKMFENYFGTSSDMILIQIERGARLFKYTYYVTFPGTHLLILGCPVTWTKWLSM